VRFLIDSMLPPRVAELLGEHGHDAMTPTRLGAHNLPDDVLVQLAAADDRVIVTENASDFAATTACPVLLVRKAWWPAASLAETLAGALDRWAKAHAEPRDNGASQARLRDSSPVSNG
jgi:hypothetical protein